MPESGLIQRLRDRLNARRAESKERAHKRKAVAAPARGGEGEAEKALRPAEHRRGRRLSRA